MSEIKKFMFVNRKAPHGTIYALESLEVVLITAAAQGGHDRVNDLVGIPPGGDGRCSVLHRELHDPVDPNTRNRSATSSGPRQRRP